MLYIGRYGEYLRDFLLSLKAIPCVWEWIMSLWKSLERGLGAQGRNASRSWSRKGCRNKILGWQQVRGKEFPGRTRHESWGSQITCLEWESLYSHRGNSHNGLEESGAGLAGRLHHGDPAHPLVPKACRCPLLLCLAGGPGHFLVQVVSASL